MNFRLYLSFAVASIALTVVGCSSSNVNAPGSTPPTSSPASPTPVAYAAPAVPTPAAFSVQSTQAVPTPAPAATAISLALPVDRTTGSTAKISLPISAQNPIPANEAITESLQSGPDASDPVFAALVRAPQSARVQLDATSRVTLSLMRLVFNSDITFSQGLGLSFTISGTYPTAGVNYFVAFYDPARPILGWQQGYENSPTISQVSLANGGGPGTQFSFSGNPNPITFSAYQTYRFLLYAVAAAAPAPTAAPTNIPTVAPSPTPAPVSAAPTALAFATITSPTQTIAASENGYSGPFTVRGLDNCANIVTATVSGATVTVTPQGSGACTLYVVGNVAFTAVAITVSNPTAVSVGIPALPGPSPSPSALPASGLTATPSTVALAVGASTTVGVSEPNSTGQYFASLSDPSIASLNPTIWALPGPGQFAILGRIPGSTTLQVYDSARNVVSIPITVTLASPSVNIASTAAAPIIVQRNATRNVQFILPTYPGSTTTVGTASVAPTGCVTITDSGLSGNASRELYVINAVNGAVTCTATVTFTETTAGTTATATAYVSIP